MKSRRPDKACLHYGPEPGTDFRRASFCASVRTYTSALSVEIEAVGAVRWATLSSSFSDSSWHRSRSRVTSLRSWRTRSGVSRTANRGLPATLSEIWARNYARACGCFQGLSAMLRVETLRLYSRLVRVSPVNVVVPKPSSALHRVLPVGP